MDWENYFKMQKIISFLCFWTLKYKVNLSRKNFWTSPDKALELLSTNVLSFYFSILLFSPEMQSLQYLNFSLFSLWTCVTFLCICRITRNCRWDAFFAILKHVIGGRMFRDRNSESCMEVHVYFLKQIWVLKIELRTWTVHLFKIKLLHLKK